MINLISPVLLLTTFGMPVQDATSPRDVTVTIVLCGADSDEDVQLLFKSLRSVKGVTVVTDQIDQGFRRFNNRFTTPIVVKVPLVPGDTDANIGSLARAIAETQTSDREKYPPGVNLILFTDDTVEESSISALRSSLSSVNGVEVNQPGGLGGNLQDGWCWIRLENAGGAMLNEIEQKAKDAGVRLRRLKDEASQ